LLQNIWERVAAHMLDLEEPSGADIERMIRFLRDNDATLSGLEKREPRRTPGEVLEDRKKALPFRNAKAS
tara:strand:- start:134 stop:343 length:210 start_codon:yes stop_codon:yes gene_type:complete